MDQIKNQNKLILLTQKNDPLIKVHSKCAVNDLNYESCDSLNNVV